MIFSAKLLLFTELANNSYLFYNIVAKIMGANTIF